MRSSAMLRTCRGRCTRLLEGNRRYPGLLYRRISVSSSLMIPLRRGKPRIPAQKC